ncbi:LysR family transcriptional regulator [Tropicimonas marinistellae]|uniref:LysR family transcriptional regulator n=1 Tax=Tropicimonas marinistellae TaxID=1739787 RepID=UPI000831FECF|nr:LysR family transcriptional regulator [Tropicimonas marinistellae]
MRLPLATLEIFNAIATQGSMRAAADALGIKPSTVSHQLKSLEDQLGTALFIRTTRSVSLTEAGRALLRGASPAFEQLTDAVESARTTGHAARGSLKLAMPEFAYHQLIGRTLPSFRDAYPEIEVELSLTDALSDILDEGLHAGFRLGNLVAQDMVAVRLTDPLPIATFAAPDYLVRKGTPKRPEDLLDHECIRYRFASSGRFAAWNFVGHEGEFQVDVSGHLIVNTLPIAVDTAVQGGGLIQIFRDYAASEIATGSLVEVLTDHQPTTPGLYIYFPREYRSMMPLRLFIEHLKATARG